MKAKLYDANKQKVLATINIHVPAELVIWPGKYEAPNREDNYAARFFLYDADLSEFTDDRRMVVTMGFHEAAVTASVGPHLGRLGV